MSVSIRPTESSSLFGQRKTTISRGLDATPHIPASVEGNAVPWWSRSAKLERELPVTMCGKSINPPQLQVSSQLQRFPCQWATAGSFCTLLRIEGKGRSHASQAESCVVFIVCSASDGVLSHWYIVFAFQGVESV